MKQVICTFYYADEYLDIRKLNLPVFITDKTSKDDLLNLLYSYLETNDIYGTPVSVTINDEEDILAQERTPNFYYRETDLGMHQRHERRPNVMDSCNYA